jgi:DNA-binding MarR family transcriptional regulator
MPEERTPPSDIERIERSMRAFKRIGDAQRVQRRMQRLAGVELDPSAFVAIMRIAEHGPIRLTDLAHQLWLDLSVVSRKVRQLEDRGLVERVVDPSDARAALVAITDAGREIADRLASGRQQMLDGLFGSWGERDTKRFADLLDRFVTDVIAIHESEDHHA